MDGENQNSNNVNLGAENQKGTEQIKNEEVNYEELIKTDKKLQAFLDSRVTNSNKTAVENAKKQWQLELDTEKTEAEKLAKMNETQKLEYELKKQKKLNEENQKKLNARDLKDEAIKIASEKGLDVSLLSFFNFEMVKAETISNKIDEISTAFNKAVEKAVNERLKEDTPITKPTSTIDKKTISRASY